MPSPSLGQIALGAATAVVTLLLGRKAYALYKARRALATDNAPAPPCVPHLASIHGSGTRDMNTVRWIVIHATDGGTSAAGIGNYFASPVTNVALSDADCSARGLPSGCTVKQPGGSSNVVVGDDGCIESVPDDVIPAGAPPLNEEGLHIEFVGQSKWTREQWFEHPDTLENGRRIIRDWSRKYDIPRTLLTSQELKDKTPGTTTHSMVTQTWHKTDHLDPGPGFPLDYVLGDGQP